jgi:tetratricopeptide (TPR) repeat protein
MHIGAKALPGLLLVFTTGAFAASTADWSRCIFHSDVIGPGIEACTRIIQAGGVETHLLVVAYVSRGIEYEARDYDRAIADFTKAIELDPQDPMAYDRRGGAYYRKGDYEQAIVDYNKVRELNPHYANVFFNLGISYKALGGSLDLAIGYLTAATNVNPKDGDAYWMRGESYQVRREFYWAVADFNKALELGGEDRNFPRSDYYELHGCSLDYAIANDPPCIEPASHH